MNERMQGTMLGALIVAVAGGCCACGGSAATGTGPGNAACPSHDEAHLFVDGVEQAPLKVLGGGGTGAVPTEASPDEASLILTTTLASGEQREAFVNLRALTVGSGISLAPSSLEYRVYPPTDGGGPPSVDTQYPGAKLTGTLDVLEIAMQPGGSICGTFDITGQGTPVLRVTGAFHHAWPGPMPGGS